MLKRGALALSAAVVISIHGLAPSSARAASPDDTAPGGVAVTDEEVIIEARKTTPQSIDPKATHTQDVITAKQLSEIPVTTDFIQALQYLPNVDVYEQGGNGLNGSNITINGFDNTRLNFTLDGIPINDNDSYSFYSNEFAQNLDIAHISVSPGAGTATTVGLSAFGGSVDILTKDPSAQHDVYVQGGAGSFGTYSEYVKVNSGEMFKDVVPTSAFLSFDHASSDGYFENSGTDYKDSLLFKSASQIGPGTLTLLHAQTLQQFHYYGGCQASSTFTTYPSSSLAKVTGATSPPYPTLATDGNSCNVNNASPYLTYYTGYEINHYEDSLSYAGYSLDLDHAKIDNKVYLYFGKGYGGAAEVAGRFDPAQYTGQILPERSWNITTRFGDVLTASVPLGDVLTLRFGTLFQHSLEHHFEGVYTPVSLAAIPGDLIYDETVLTTTAEPYVDLLLQPFPQLIIDAGAKYLMVDRNFYDNLHPVNDKQHSFRTALPSISANYEFTPGFHAYVNYTQNARPPGYSNDYATFPNPNLQLEKAATFEAGLLARSGNLEGRISGFHTKYSNYILSLEIPDPDPTKSDFGNGLANVGDAEYYGGSLALTYQFAPWLSAFLNGGWLHTNIDFYHTPVNNAPKETGSAGFEVQTGGFSGSMAVHYRGSRLDWGVDTFGFVSGGKRVIVNTFSFYPLPSMTTLDASLAYKWDAPFGASSFKTAETRLTFTNITNEQKPVSASASSLTNFTLGNPLLYLSEPFSVYATLTLAF
jgi:iron complex outermembrane receptor protein